MNIKNKIRVTLMAMAAFLATGSLTSCSDEPDSEYFYTFTGEMMSDYLKNRPQYSMFAAICERADLMDLLATYGQYTCFLPNDSAVGVYLHERGLSSIDGLSDADCDTIARTHLVANMYSTYEMNQDRLATANMLGRYLATSVDSVTAEIVIEGLAHVYYDLKDDSVENGIVHPINMVIEKSNSYVADILRDNPRISIFYQGLVATNVREQILPVEDPNYNFKSYKKYYYKSHTWSEVG